MAKLDRIARTIWKLKRISRRRFADFGAAELLDPSMRPSVAEWVGGIEQCQRALDRGRPRQPSWIARAHNTIADGSGTLAPPPVDSPKWLFQRS